MRVRRHFEAFEGFKIDSRFWKWLGIAVATMLAGYLTAYCFLFPAPFLPGHQAVPRVLGLSVVGTLDLALEVLKAIAGPIVPIDPFARYCLMNGVDELGFLLSQEPAISAFESRRS